MMMTQIHPFAGNHSLLLRNPAHFTAPPADESQAPSVVNPLASDELSVTEPTTPGSSVASYERLSLRIHSQSQASQSTDGQLTTQSHTRLRFSYDFQAADGTTIRLNAKLNLRYRQTSDDDSQSYSLKLRAKAQVSVLQQNVSSGVGSLLDSPEISAEAQTAIAQALDLFQQVADSATSTFLASNPLDGDPLITGIVDAFNTLATSIGATSPIGSAAPQELPTGDPVALPPSATAESIEVPATESTTSEIVEPVNVAVEPPLAVPPQDIALPTLPGGDVADNADAANQAEVPVRADAVAAGSGEVEGMEEGIDTQPAPAPTASEQRQLSASSVLLSVRVKVIQSLTSLVGVFGADSSSTTVSQSTFQASAQLLARYSFVAQNSDATVAPDNHIDAQA